MIASHPAPTTEKLQVLEMLNGERVWQQGTWVKTSLDSLIDSGLASPLPELRITALGRRVLKGAQGSPQTPDAP